MPHGAARPPAKQPGAVVAIRVLTFIAAILALVFAGQFLEFLSDPGGPTHGSADGAASERVHPDTAIDIATVGTGLCGGYGLVSLFLASIGGRRSGRVWWGQFVLQVPILLLSPLILLANGWFGASVFALYIGAIVLLLCLGSSRAWYTG